MVTAKRPIDEFFLALCVVLVLPLVPLIVELLITFVFKPSTSLLLEPASVMITAPLFAVSVGIASRYKAVFAVSLLLALCLAAMYGARFERSPSSEAASQPKLMADGNSISTDNAKAPLPKPFLTRIGMSDTAERTAWIGIISMTVVLLIERGIRHIKYQEPYEFEWNK
jgi:hypothetical protein